MNTNKNRLNYVLILGALASLGPLCTDLYLPALPELTAQLHANTAAGQLSLTAGLFGLGAGQLLLGPLSDTKGRIYPLIGSLLVLFIASIACALAQSSDQLIAARLIQGLAGGGGAVLSRAVARDLYSGHALTHFFSLLMLVNGVAPIVAPVLGGALLGIMSWRGIFVVLAIISLLLLAASLLGLTETLPREKRVQGTLGNVFSSLAGLFGNRQFMGLCLTQGFIMAGMFAYIGASPFVLQEIYQLSPQQFSLCFAINGIGLIVAAQLASLFSRRYGEMAVLKCALGIAAIASILLVVACSVHAPLLILLVPLFFSVIIVSIVGTSAGSLAMQSHGDQAGSASALLGVSMFALGGISVPLTGIGGTSALTMGLTIVSCYLIAIVLFVTLVNSKKRSH